MSLNKKAFILLSSLIGLALILIMVASRAIIFGQFRKLEMAEAGRNAYRVVNGLNEIIRGINTLNADWAYWDDAYNFVKDRNEEFIEVNLADSTFTNAKLNAIIFTDNEGRIVYQKGFDNVSREETPVSPALLGHIKREDLLITHIGQDSISGVVVLPEGAMLVSSNPIFKSDGTGPTIGTLIMARYIGADVSERLNELTQFEVEFNTPEESVKNILKDRNQIEIISEKIIGNKLEINVFIPDIYGKDGVVASISMPRDIYNQARNILTYFVLAVILIGSIVLTAGIFYQDRFILSPIHKIIQSVNEIRIKGDLTRRVEYREGKDEISQLGQNINAMLTSIQEFQKTTRESEMKLAERVGVIEKQNKELEKTKTAMMNILEDEKELEETLKKEHDRLDLIISSMGEGLLVIDKNFKISMINPIAQKLLDIKADDVVGKKWSEITQTLKDHQSTPVSERSFSRAVNNGETIVTSLDNDHSYKTKSGKVFPIISITAPLKVGGEIVGAVKVFRDATSEKQSRAVIEKEVKLRTQALWEERARMVSSINSLHMGFIIADKKHNIIVKNPAVSDITGIPDSKITFERISQEFAANMDLKSVCEECLKRQTSFGKDDIYYKDKILRVFLTPVVVAEQKGAAIGYVLLIEDVTEEKQLVRAKDEFFAVASHELRTPLTAIRGNTSLIQDYFADKIEDADLKEMIDDMHESSIRLINIVNDFLDASRLEQGRVVLKKEEFDIVSLMRDVVNELDEFAGQRGLAVKITDPGGELKVYADRARTHQIGNNLLGNAIKFTKQGEIKISFAKLEDTVKVLVTDTGAGISPANQRLLFKKFQQAGEKVLARDVTKGTGMGLYISKLLVELMGGKVYLDKSELGKGSTFAFELPIGKHTDKTDKNE